MTNEFLLMSDSRERRSSASCSLSRAASARPKNWGRTRAPRAARVDCNEAVRIAEAFRSAGAVAGDGAMTDLRLPLRTRSPSDSLVCTEMLRGDGLDAGSDVGLGDSAGETVVEMLGRFVETVGEGVVETVGEVDAGALDGVLDDGALDD